MLKALLGLIGRGIGLVLGLIVVASVIMLVLPLLFMYQSAKFGRPKAKKG